MSHSDDYSIRFKPFGLQGYSKEERALLGLKLLPPDKTREMFGFGLPSVLFPRFDINGTNVGPFMARLPDDRPAWAKPKYICPKGSRSSLYFPPNQGNIRNKLSNGSCRLVITEGAKKAFRAGAQTDDRTVVCAVQGTWNFTNKETGGILADLAALCLPELAVYIAYDNDRPEGKCYGNSHVLLAAYRLHGALSMAGANDVSFIRLEPWDMSIKKIGLDDALEHGHVTLPQLIDEAQSQLVNVGENISVQQALMETSLNLRYRYDRETDSIFYLDSLREEKLQWGTCHQFKMREGEKVPVRAGDKIKYVKGSELWLDSTNRAETKGIRFNPGQPTGITPEGYINTWRGFAVEPSPPQYDSEGWNLWRRLEEARWENVSPDSRKWADQWIGHMFQRPGEPVQTAIIMRSDMEGVGKSILGDVLAYLVGYEQTAKITGDTFEDNLSPELLSKLFAFADELPTMGGKRQAAKLRDYITGERIRIRLPYIGSISAKNYLRWFITTNEPRVAQISGGDRRFFVVEITSRALSEAEIEQLKHWLENEGGYSQILGHYQSIDLQGFIPTGIAPDSDAKQRLREENDGLFVSAWRAAVYRGEYKITMRGTIFFINDRNMDNGGAEPLPDVLSGDQIEALIVALQEHHPLLRNQKTSPKTAITQLLRADLIYNPLGKGVSGRTNITVNGERIQSRFYAFTRTSIELFKQKEWSARELVDLNRQPFLAEVAPTPEGLERVRERLERVVPLRSIKGAD